MSIVWNGNNINSVIWNGINTTGIWNGQTIWGDSSPVVSPFNEVDSALFDRNYGIKWGSTPGINSNYCYPKAQPINPMLYRKVTVNSPITITAFDTNCNQGIATTGTGVAYSPSNLNTTAGLWPAYVTIYDSGLNSITINSEPLTSTVTVGDSTSYIETGDGKNYKWYFIHTECNVTLSAGYYWWPIFQRRHNTLTATHYGYYSGVSGDMLALRQWNIIDDATYPPLYLQTTNMPYLKLTDSNSNEWYV